MPRTTRGVGDFDTSDLPGGSRPSNGAYRRDYPKSEKFRVKEVSSRASRILLDTYVETLRADTVNGYSVTVNMHNGDSSKLQVFIDNVKLDTSIVEYVSMDDYIRSHTR